MFSTWPPIHRGSEIASFLSFKNYDNILGFSYAVMCVFALAKTYILTTACVADVLPAHIVAGKLYDVLSAHIVAGKL